MTRTHRDEVGAFLVEGPLVISEALRSGAHVREVFTSLGRDEGAWEALARSRGVPVWRSSPEVVAALSETTTPQGAVAVVDAPSGSVADLPCGADLVVVLDEVRDPGNAGTLIRSAVAAGASAVVFCRGAVDPLHPKTVRASAGALFHIPVLRGVSLARALEALRSAGLTVLGADPHGGTACDRVDLTSPVAIVLGNEAWGMTPEARDAVDGVVSIPMPGAAESLNVGIAGSILLFEVVRQRRQKTL